MSLNIGSDAVSNATRKAFSSQWQDALTKVVIACECYTNTISATLTPRRGWSSPIKPLLVLGCPMQAELESRSYIEPSCNNPEWQMSTIEFNNVRFEVLAGPHRCILIGIQFPAVMERPSLVLQTVEGLGYSNIDMELVELESR